MRTELREGGSWSYAAGSDQVAKVEAAYQEIAQKISTDNLSEVSDFEGYQSDFLKLFGFGLSDVNYDAETDPIREIDLVQ